MSRACLHEIHAPWSADAPAAAGFSLGLALRAAPGRPVFWVRQDVLEGEGGRLNGMGLAEFGVDPAALSLVRGKDAEAVLRAGVEAARCKSLGAALIEIFGAPRALDLTATLRLARAAEDFGRHRVSAAHSVQVEGAQDRAAAQRRRLSLAGAGAKFARPPRQCAGRALFFRHAAASSRRRGRSFLAFGVAA